MTSLFLACAFALASGGEPEDVRQHLASDIDINWTSLAIEVTSSARGWGVGSTTKAVEHRARQGIGADVIWAAERLPVTSELTLRDLGADEELGHTLQARSERWVVAEARYFTSGRIELVGELSLKELLKPWTLARAVQDPPEPRATGYTGLVLDARGTHATPAFAPRVLHGDQVIFGAELWDDVALFQAPVIYVPDPAHPAAARAGTNPLVLVPEAAKGADLDLGREDFVRFRTAFEGTRVLGEGTVVIVVDAP